MSGLVWEEGGEERGKKEEEKEEARLMGQLIYLWVLGHRERGGGGDGGNGKQKQPINNIFTWLHLLEI